MPTPNRSPGAQPRTTGTSEARPQAQGTPSEDPHCCPHRASVASAARRCWSWLWGPRGPKGEDLGAESLRKGLPQASGPRPQTCIGADMGVSEEYSGLQGAEEPRAVAAQQRSLRLQPQIPAVSTPPSPAMPPTSPSSGSRGPCLLASQYQGMCLLFAPLP